jgi:hypothetical protein
LREAGDGQGLPAFVDRATDAYLRCGVLRHGFLNAKCDRCGTSIVVAFSCKQRGICSSCGGKRMVEEGAHLVDHVFPRVPVRQFVLTLPFQLRYVLAWNHELRDAVLRAFMRALERHYRDDALARGGVDPKFAAVSVLQRFDGAVRTHVHWHVLAADGAWVSTADGSRRFERAPRLRQVDVEALLVDAIGRIGRQLERHLAGDGEDDRDRLAERDPALAALLKAAILGKHESERSELRRLAVGKGPVQPKPHGRNCAQALGFSLHANTRVGELNRTGLEKLCRYVCRPAVAAHRVEETLDGKIRITLKNEWAGGIRAIVVSPRDLVLRLLAQIPLPRRVLLRYHGCFAPASPQRAQVVAAGARAPRRRHKGADAGGTVGQATVAATAEQATQRMSWAVCLRRTFRIDALACPCGGRRKLVAAVLDKGEVERFLKHLSVLRLPEDVVAIRGPPEELVPVEPIPEDHGDGWETGSDEWATA